MIFIILYFSKLSLVISSHRERDRCYVEQSAIERECLATISNAIDNTTFVSKPISCHVAKFDEKRLNYFIV